jgi:hypothetical protein
MDFTFAEIIKNIILKSSIRDSYNHTYHNQKYALSDIISEIIYVLKTGISWRNIRGIIKWQSIVYHFNKFRDTGIFKKALNKLLRIYKKDINKSEISYLTDTTFIKNNIGLSNTGRNPIFKNKNCFKLSFLSDLNGIPLDIQIGSGNLSEKSYLDKHIKYVLKNKSKVKTNLLADAGYDSSITRKKLIDNNIYPIIPFNKRNTKDNAKIKYLNDDDKKLYKRRIKIENLFSWIKKNKRISEINEKIFSSYLNFVYLAVGLILFRRLYS